MEVKFRKASIDVKTPSYAYEGDAGLDLYAHRIVTKNGYTEYFTGICLEIPYGYVGYLFPRSSISDRPQFVANAVGVIDPGYRGEVSVRMKRINGVKEMYDEGDKVCQLIIMEKPTVKLIECDTLSDSSRSINGYGSSGEL